jgi:ankyrin repeat protein
VTKAIAAKNIEDFRALFDLHVCDYGTGEEKECQSIGSDFAHKPDENGNSPVVLAINARWVIGLKLLIECGADLNAPDKNGTTALILAVLMRWHVGIELLVNGGATIDGPGMHGVTPVLVACCTALPSVLKFLTDKRNKKAK